LYEICIQELLNRWQHIVSDHQQLDDMRQNFLDSQKDIVSRLNGCVPGRETRYSLQMKLTKLQELLQDKENGFGKLQDILNQGDIVVISTAPVGKDTINSLTSEIDRSFSGLVEQMNRTRDSLEMAIFERQSFDTTLSRLAEWIQGVENQLHVIRGDLPGTLPELQSRTDKAAVLTCIHYLKYTCCIFGSVVLSVSSAPVLNLHVLYTFLAKAALDKNIVYHV